MKEVILLIIAAIFATIYNVILIVVHMASADDELTTTSAVLTILNTFKDAMMFSTILFSIFLGWSRGGDKMEEVNKNVSHPSHYNQGIEAIDIIESWDLNFSLGNAIKYILRSPYKGKQIEDLEKARWYIDREINRLKGDE